MDMLYHVDTHEVFASSDVSFLENNFPFQNVPQQIPYCVTTSHTSSTRVGLLNNIQPKLKFQCHQEHLLSSRDNYPSTDHVTTTTDPVLNLLLNASPLLDNGSSDNCAAIPACVFE